MVVLPLGFLSHLHLRKRQPFERIAMGDILYNRDLGQRSARFLFFT